MVTLLYRPLLCSSISHPSFIQRTSHQAKSTLFYSKVVGDFFPRHLKHPFLYNKSFQMSLLRFALIILSKPTPGMAKTRLGIHHNTIRLLNDSFSGPLVHSRLFLSRSTLIISGQFLVPDYHCEFPHNR